MQLCWDCSRAEPGQGELSVAVTGDDGRGATGCGIPDHLAWSDGAPHRWNIMHTPLSVYSMAELQRVFDERLPTT